MFSLFACLFLLFAIFVGVILFRLPGVMHELNHKFVSYQQNKIIKEMKEKVSKDLK